MVFKYFLTVTYIKKSVLFYNQVGKQHANPSNTKEKNLKRNNIYPLLQWYALIYSVPLCHLWCNGPTLNWQHEALMGHNLQFEERSTKQYYGGFKGFQIKNWAMGYPRKITEIKRSWLILQGYHVPTLSPTSEPKIFMKKYRVKFCLPHQAWHLWK